MSKITRKTQQIFGGTLVANNNIAEFGSLKLGSPAYSLDPDLIQTDAFKSGWAAAVVNNNAPALQDMNALFFLLSRQVAYMMQSGIPEYDTATTYFIGSLVNDGTGTIYKSIADNNTGNALSDTTKWAYNRSLARAGLISPYAGSAAPSGWSICDGSTLLEANYQDLFTNIGSTWNLCTNPTTGLAYTAPSSGYFRIPDLRSAFLRGVGATNPDGITTTLAGYQADATGKNSVSGTLSFSATTGTESQTHTHPSGVWNQAVAGSQQGYSLSVSGSMPNTGTESQTHTHTVSGNTSNVTGLTFDPETRPQNVGVNYIIKLYNDQF